MSAPRQLVVLDHDVDPDLDLGVDSILDQAQAAHHFDISRATPIAPSAIASAICG